MNNLSSRIPAGVDTGARLCYRGMGEAGVNGGPPGDLYIYITVETSKPFRRQGQDLVVARSISFPQAALGHRLTIPGLDEELEFETPKGAQSGSVYRMHGQGLPYLNQPRRGDLLVEITVATPTKLSPRQEALLREFAELENDKPLASVKKMMMNKVGKVGKAVGKAVDKAMGVES
jgi:molecular chaperone DnaJ